MNIELTTLNYIKAFSTVGVLSVIFGLETWLPFFHGRQRRIIHARRNLAIAVLNAVILGLLFSKPTSMIADWTASLSLGIIHRLNINTLVDTLLAIILMDGWMYLWHRANHRISFLWRFHRMHLSDPQMDVTTALRFHTGEHVFSSLLRFAVIPLLGMNLWQLIFYEILLLPIIQFHQSNVNLPESWDRCLRTIIVTPNIHRVHHSRWQPETDSNYSSIFSFWDRVFGSFRLRKDPHTIQYGLYTYDAQEWQTTWGMLKTPFLTTFLITK